MKNLNIPVGISDFEKIRREGFYYIDKTGLVKELLNPKPAEVTLNPRPRRFGKTLAMSMLKTFSISKRTAGICLQDWKFQPVRNCAAGG